MVSNLTRPSRAPDCKKASPSPPAARILPSGAKAASLNGFGRVSQGRFAEYQEALEAGSSLQALGHRAWLRISGTDEPSERMTMLLAIRARAELEKLRGIGREYTVSEKAVPTLPPVTGVTPEWGGPDR